MTPLPDADSARRLHAIQTAAAGADSAGDLDRSYPAPSSNTEQHMRGVAAELVSTTCYPGSRSDCLHDNVIVIPATSRYDSRSRVIVAPGA